MFVSILTLAMLVEGKLEKMVEEEAITMKIENADDAHTHNLALYIRINVKVHYLDLD